MKLFKFIFITLSLLTSLALVSNLVSLLDSNESDPLTSSQGVINSSIIENQITLFPYCVISNEDDTNTYYFGYTNSSNRPLPLTSLVFSENVLKKEVYYYGTGDFLKVGTFEKAFKATAYKQAGISLTLETNGIFVKATADNKIVDCSSGDVNRILFFHTENIINGTLGVAVVEKFDQSRLSSFRIRYCTESSYCSVTSKTAKDLGWINFSDANITLPPDRNVLVKINNLPITELGYDETYHLCIQFKSIDGKYLPEKCIQWGAEKDQDLYELGARSDAGIN